MRRLKKGDEVVVLAGKDKGKRGVVLKVIQDLEKIVVAQAEAQAENAAEVLDSFYSETDDSGKALAAHHQAIR